MPATVSFFDMEVNITPPGGHAQPVPITLGANWQPNDYRLLFVSASGANNDITLMVPMDADPPTGFTTAYSIDPGVETRGVYYNLLAFADTDTSVAFPKPPNWRDFMFGTLTARGASPTTAPIGGALTTSYTVGATTATVASVTVPAAGTMVFFLGCVADPEGGWPSWPSSIGVPTGWTPLVATDKSGVTYYQYDTNPAICIVGKSYSTSGTTGSVAFPVTQGSPAFTGMYAFLQPALDVSVAVGAA